MTVIWLIVWLISRTPQVEMFGSWNSWGTALLVCLAIDLLGALSAGSWRRRDTYFHGFGRTWRPGSGWSDREPHEGSGPA
jgi:hypothetical protein